jgi:hypothetical protein
MDIVYTHIYKHALNFKQKSLIKWDLYFEPLFPLEIDKFDRVSSNQLLIFCTQLGGNTPLDPCSTTLRRTATDFHYRAWDLITFISVDGTVTYYWSQKLSVFIIAFDSVTPQNLQLLHTSSILNFWLFIVLDICW